MAQLGDRAKDRISGMTGIVVGTSEFLYGCRQVCLRPEEVKDGKPVEGTWFDDQQTIVIEAGVVSRTSDESSLAANPGGPSLHGQARN